jgi:predicted CXXCH cytochrome family protein
LAIWTAIFAFLALGALCWIATRRHAESFAKGEHFVISDYAGSASCRACHEEEYTEWAKSHHGLAETAVDSNSFPTASGLNMITRNGKHFANISGTNYAVDRVIGVEPLVQLLFSTTNGRWQALDTAWDTRRHEWFNVFGTEERLPGEWGHWTGRGMNWNSMCAFCHNTALRKNYDPRSDSYHTTMSERSVGCEACHGPAKAHVAWQQRDAKSGRKDPTLPPLGRRQKLDTCGACHARRSELTGDFKPGDDFFDHFDLAMADATDLYYPDGQVHDEDYEYASFLGSRMGARGVDCLDCHQAHSAKTRLPGNFLCLRCHNGSYTNAPVIDPVAHSHHRVHGYDTSGKLVDTDLAHFRPEDIRETGGECVNCHMPQKVYMQRQSRHDHGLSIPDPLLTKECGIPNACNRCHQDKDVDWAATHVDQWYGQSMERPSRQRTRSLAAARSGNPAAIEPLLIEPLLKTLAVETNSYWKAAIINYLQPWAAEPRVAAVLRQSLTDSDALVRTKAAHALDGEWENQVASETTDALRARLQDSVRSVRVGAAWALRATLDPQGPAGHDLDLFLEANADQPGGQLQLGQFALAKGESRRALEHYRTAVAWDPASAATRRDLAVLYSQLNQNREALEQLREAVRLEPREAEYHFSLALALSDAGEVEHAIAELREAVRLNPRYADAWRNLGLALAAQNDLNAASDALTRAETADPADPRIPYARATVLARLGRAGEARAAAERALSLRADYAEAQELLRSLSVP